MEKTIVCLPGDGIGPEIMECALKVLKVIEKQYNHSFTLDYHYFGGIAIDVSGAALPEDTLVACLSADAVLLAAIGGPKWTNGVERPEKGLLKLRKSLGLYSNVRPVQLYKETLSCSPLKPELLDDVDFVVVRELTGGIYFAEPKFYSDELATDTLTYSREEIERIATFSFELAKARRNKVTLVDKANVLESSRLWRKVTGEVAKRYPMVELEHLYVDAAAMELIRKPSRFDVLLTENLFGDILSDEASMLAGSLGMLPSASYPVSGPALYEPIHGSAPDIAGMKIANPIAMIRSVSMMLLDFGLKKESNVIENAIQRTLEKGFFTMDLGGNTNTEEFTEQIIEELSAKVF